MPGATQPAWRTSETQEAGHQGAACLHARSVPLSHGGNPCNLAPPPAQRSPRRAHRCRAASAAAAPPLPDSRAATRPAGQQTGQQGRHRPAGCDAGGRPAWPKPGCARLGRAGDCLGQVGPQEQQAAGAKGTGPTSLPRARQASRNTQEREVATSQGLNPTPPTPDCNGFIRRPPPHPRAPSDAPHHPPPTR